MNIYVFSTVTMIIGYILIGFLLRGGTRSTKDYYLAGKKANLVLVTGSMTASVFSSSMFTGTAGTIYSGAFSSQILLMAIASMGYVIGVIVFGRFLQRSDALTVSEFLGVRFCSVRVRRLSALIGCFGMAIYLISVTQGIAMIMSQITNLPYKICVIAIVICYGAVVYFSGSKGVLITDTLMAFVFIMATVLAFGYVMKDGGGWFEIVKKITNSDPKLLSWNGKLVQDLGIQHEYENIIRNTVYGFFWGLMYVSSPMSASRYMMAKDENTAIRSAAVSSILIFIFFIFISMFAVSLNIYDIGNELPSQVVIWTALHVLPTFIGIILLLGILSAGISSATTFVSLICSSGANDIKCVDQSKSVKFARVLSVLVCLVIAIVTLVSPPSIFAFLSFGVSLIAAALGPIGLLSMYSKKTSEKGAYYGMLTGFIICLLWKIAVTIGGYKVPIIFDPGVVGVVFNSLIIFVLNYRNEPSTEELNVRNNLFKKVQRENNDREYIVTKWYLTGMIAAGFLIMLLLYILWVRPYLNN